MINLSKGGSVDLTKEAGGTLTKVRIGLGWDASNVPGVEFDLDASVFGLGADGKALAPEWFVFFNNLASPGKEIVHQGDERTGDTEGDDEQIVVDLAALPAAVQSLAVHVAIFEAAKRGGLNFAQVSNAYVHVTNEDTGVELARYDLSSDAGPDANTVHFATLTRQGGSWELTAVGEGATGEIDAVVAKYGLN